MSQHSLASPTHLNTGRRAELLAQGLGAPELPRGSRSAPTPWTRTRSARYRASGCARCARSRNARWN